VKGEGEHIRLANDNLWNDTQWLQGRGASTGPQPVAQGCAENAAAQSKSCADELQAPEVTVPNTDTSMKRQHPKGNNGCSSMKMTWPAAQMKCVYLNAHSMGNKQEELEARKL